MASTFSSPSSKPQSKTKSRGAQQVYVVEEIRLTYLPNNDNSSKGTSFIRGQFKAKAKQSKGKLYILRRSLHAQEREACLAVT